MTAYRLEIEDIGDIITITNRDVPWSKRARGLLSELAPFYTLTEEGIFIDCELIKGDAPTFNFINHDIATAEKEVKGFYICPELGVNSPVPFADILRAVKRYLEKGDRYLMR